MNTWLDKVHGPEDIRNLSTAESAQLAQEIRTFLVDSVSETGGHLSANLGVVELSIALHQVFNTPTDKIVWDVGHQAYTHKILTGRKDQFSTLRQKDGLSGFPKAEESEYDVFDTGHASTSISAAYGLAKARDRKGEDYAVVAVIGDGSITGGLAYEAMNNAGKDKTHFIVVINDNGMSISRNVGSMPLHLSWLRTRQGYLRGKRSIKKAVKRFPILRPLYRAADFIKNKTKYLFVKGILFEELGFTYLGPVDGHDIRELKAVLTQAKSVGEPVVVHVKTTKGKGYELAEKNPERYHGIGQFDKTTGEELAIKQETWSDTFGSEVTKLGKQDPAVAVVTAAMPLGTGLDHFAEEMPDQFYDVGIAEEHAVTFAAGLAKGGLKPFVAIYSSFLQRAYDQILHDVCLPQLPVVFAIDRAGAVGEDGETHQGVFDLAYLSHIPGMTVLAPSDKNELKTMLQFAYELKRPVAIRYPRGIVPQPTNRDNEPIEYGKSRIIQRGSKVAILAVGICLEEAAKAAVQMEAEGQKPSLVDVRFVAPMDETMLRWALTEHEQVIVIEDHVYTGGYGMRVAALAAKLGSKAEIKPLSLPDQFLAQDTRRHILEHYGLTAEGILTAWKQKENA